MSWETTLYTGISFVRETYDSKIKIEDDLKNTRDLIKLYEKRLNLFTTMTEPNKFCPKDENPILWITSETDDALSELKSLYIVEFKLELLLENFDKAYDKESNTFKSLPKEFKYDDAFIEGDYINNNNDDED